MTPKRHHTTTERRPAAEGSLPLVIIRSTKRVRTVGAQVRDGELVLRVPSWMPDTDVERWAAEMAQRFARKHQAAEIDLDARARLLARAHELPQASSVRWVGDLATRWGSCTPATGQIRISSRLATVPTWVLDYVLVHELAHLVVPDHSARFWAVVGRYPRAERARGYLLALARMPADGLAPSPGNGDDGDEDDAEPDDVEGPTPPLAQLILDSRW